MTIVEGSVPTVFELDGEQFRATDEQPLDGFYDWLRSERNTVVGARVSSEGLLASLSSHPSVLASRVLRLDDRDRLEIAFRDAQYVKQLSDDQAFGGAWLYKSKKGRFALSLEMYFLSEEERLSIESADADWKGIITG